MNIDRIEQERRNRTVSLVVLFGILITSVFVVIDFLEDEPIEIAVDFIVLLVLAFSSFFLRKRSIEQKVYKVALAILFLLLTFLVVNGSGQGSVLYWMLILPLLTFFLLGKKNGLIYSAVFLVALTIFFIFPSSESTKTYPGEVFYRFLIAYFFFSVVSYGIELSRERFKELLIAENRKLEREKLQLVKTQEELERADGDLKKAYSEMETKIVERTLELQKAKEDAEKANRMKSEFLANISHELRTPLHAILSYSHFGISKFKSIDDRKKLHYFNQINMSGDRLKELIENLLDLTAFDTGTEDLKPEPVDLEQLAREIISIFESVSREAGISITMQEPSVKTDLMCDRNRISQVFQHLLANAFKVSEKGRQIRIAFSLQELTTPQNSQAGAGLMASVIDNGIGIPEDELVSIFDRFAQSSRTKTGAGGRGLGLSICHEIINAHNGKIWAENNPEGGAIFRFVLPYNGKRLIPDT